MAPAVGDQRHQAQSPAVFGGRVACARGRSRRRPLISDSNADPRPTLLDDDLELAFITRRRVQQGVGGQLGHAQDCFAGDRAARQCPATNRRAWATCSWRPGNTRRFARATAASSHAVAVAALGCLCQCACRCPVRSHEAPISPRRDPPPGGRAPRIAPMGQSSRTQQAQPITRRYHETG